jgi:hypothetical protein
VRVVLALVVVVAPVAAGAAAIVMGVARRLAPWPWLVGLGVAFVPAAYMAAVDLCHVVAGTCVTGGALSDSRQAAISVAAFAAAAALMAARRSPARDAAFAALVLLGQLWLLVKLLALDEVPAAVLVVALIALGVGYELVVRVRARPAAA